MRHDLNFNFDGKNSYDMGIVKINLSSSLFEDAMIANKRIIEEKIDGKDKPYHYGVERDPLSFPLPVLFEDNLSTDKVREILRWLDQDDYKPFYMSDNPDRIWYAMIHNDANLIHNGIQAGYLTLDVRTDSAYTQSPFFLSEIFTFTGNTGGQIIEFENRGDFKCKPYVHIQKTGNGNITISNLTNNTGDFTFTDLVDGEELVIDCENKDIETSIVGYRYDKFSNNYLTFVRGVNRLEVTGDCLLQFETEFKNY